MNYKKFFIYALVFFLGFAVGKILKINITTNGGCGLTPKKFTNLRFKSQIQSESSENYL